MRLPALALGALLLVVLSGCSAPAETVEMRFTPPAADETGVALDGPPAWYSGVLDAFDHVAETVPDIRPLRDALATDDASFGAGALATLIGDGSATPATAAPSGGGGAARPVRADVSQSMGVGSLGGDAMGNALGDPGTGALAPGESGGSNGVTATRNEDGTVTIEIAHEQGQSAGGASATTQVSVVYDGLYCPGPDGRFDATARMTTSVSGSGGGKSGSRTVEIKARVWGTLGENAFPEHMDTESTQQTTETGADGAERYITTMQHTQNFDWTGLDPEKNPPQKLGGSEGLSPEDATKLGQDAQLSAASMMLGLYTSLYRMWTNGGCVTIETDLPESVQPKSVNDFSITVVQKLTGSSVKGPLTLELNGADTLEPTESVSPGGFHYTAGDTGSSATIAITSTSRQGGAKKTITVSTAERHYLVTSTIAPWAGTGLWCQGSPEIDVSGSAGGVRMSLDGEDGGTVLSSNAATGLEAWVGSGGSFTVTRDAEGTPVAITARLTGNHVGLTGIDSYDVTVGYTLTRTETCAL